MEALQTCQSKTWVLSSDAKTWILSSDAKTWILSSDVPLNIQKIADIAWIVVWGATTKVLVSVLILTSIPNRPPDMQTT